MPFREIEARVRWLCLAVRDDFAVLRIDLGPHGHRMERVVKEAHADVDPSVSGSNDFTLSKQSLLKYRRASAGCFWVKAAATADDTLDAFNWRLSHRVRWARTAQRTEGTSIVRQPVTTCLDH